MRTEIDKKLIKEIKEYLKKINLELELVTFELSQNLFTKNTIDLLEGIVYCLKGLELTKATHNIDIQEELFKEKLQELKQAIESKEYSLASDIVKYEIFELIGDLNENLKKL